jgi:hypothetical protein
VAFNLLKNYPDLLEIDHLNERDRSVSLKRIFSRDFEKKEKKFRNGTIRPIPSKKDKMEILFKHLTTKKIYGRNDRKRSFDRDRAIRLHWVRPHICENIPEELKIFSVEEKVRGSYATRTYIYNRKEQYVVILEPYRKTDDYYLITAYYLQSRNVRKIENKMKRKLPEIH